MEKNKNLSAARVGKKDEFYTQLTDIEKEIRYYKNHFSGKVVYCNCDDPKKSNFFHYFSHNFEQLGLKELITTCYKNQNFDLFTQNNSEKSICLKYDGARDNMPEFNKVRSFHLKDDGDFRSKECIDLLKESDIVVTNPPFSLFREYVAQLMEYGKEFLIIGNVNAVTYKEIFPLIQSNQVWFGPSIKSGDREFGVPEYYPLTAASCRVDKEGRKFVRVKGVRWFTNLEFEQRHEDLILYKKYTPDEYPKFDNYDAINVDKTKDIPMDYKGAMGVPITFLDKHNPDQFEILSSNNIKLNDKIPFKEHGLIKDKDGSINGRPKYVRVVIRNKRI